MNLDISPQGVLKKLLYFIVFLLVLNTLGVISKFFFGYDSVYGLIPLFDFDTEQNIPTFYSSVALLCASILLMVIAKAHQKMGSDFLGWYGLSIIFLFLSIDEIASLHEGLGLVFRGLFNTSGLLYFAWVIPYGVAVLLILVAYLRFLMRLPKNIMILFIVSGAVFVSGAIGLELLSGHHTELHGSTDLMYSIYYTFEEFLEMLGIVLFIYTLLNYMASEFDSFSCTIQASK